MTVYLRNLWQHFCLMLGNQDSLIRYLLPLINVVNPTFLPNTYSAKVIAVVHKAENMVHLRLKVSRRWRGFDAGQHISLYISHNGRLVTRTFSICSATGLWHREREIHLCCKVQQKGSFTPLLAALKNNDKLNISRASGDFVWRHATQSSTFIAAGSGITPIASMLLSQRHWLAPVKLIYRVKTRENASLLTELFKLAEKQEMLTIELSESRDQSASEFIHSLTRLCQSGHYFVCGPSLFMHVVCQHLQQLKVHDACISQEQFGLTPLMLEVEDINQQVPTTFINAGQSKSVLLARNTSLLQGAEDNGLVPTFGCRIGVCFQCVCQKVSGQVRDMRTGQLSGNGSEQIQLCISQPLTQLVVEL